MAYDQSVYDPPSRVTVDSVLDYDLRGHNALMTDHTKLLLQMTRLMRMATQTKPSEKGDIE